MKLCWGYATNIEYVDDGKGGPKRKEKKKEKVSPHIYIVGQGC